MTDPYESVEDRGSCRQDDFDADPEKYRGAIDGVVHCMGTFDLVLRVCHHRFLIEAPNGLDGELQRKDMESPDGCLKAKLGEWATRRISSEYL